MVCIYFYLFIALGHTVSEIDISQAKGVYDKTLFSMVIPEIEEILKTDESRKSVVLFGIEVSIKYDIRKDSLLACGDVAMSC